jgi:hypothetical protein
MRVIRILPSALFPIIALMIVRPAAGQSVPPSAPPSPHLSLESDTLYVPPSNDLQKPSVGRAWTAGGGSRFEETATDTASIFDRGAAPGTNNQAFYLDSESINSSPNSTGTRDWALSFPAGSDVRSDMKLDWYRLGYRFELQKANQRDADLPIGVHSRVGVAVLDFQHKLDRPGLGDADRSYITAAPQMGLEMEWRATNKLSFAGEVTSTVPLSSMPWILTTDVRASYTLLQKHGAGLNGYIGGGYEGFSFEERQDVRNEINGDSGPMLKMGLELKF